MPGEVYQGGMASRLQRTSWFASELPKQVNKHASALNGITPRPATQSLISRKNPQNRRMRICTTDGGSHQGRADCSDVRRSQT